VRFDLLTDCLAAGCRLAIARAGRAIVRLALAGAAPGSAIDQGDLRVFFDKVERTDASGAPPLGRLRLAQLELLRAIAEAYRLVMPAALPAGVLALLIIGVASARGHPLAPAVVLGSALLAGVVLRIGFLAGVYAAVIPMVSQRYLAPAYPLALAFVVLSLALVARVVGARWPRPKV
jgi:hypothetical protein